MYNDKNIEAICICDLITNTDPLRYYSVLLGTITYGLRCGHYPLTFQYLLSFTRVDSCIFSLLFINSSQQIVEEKHVIQACIDYFDDICFTEVHPTMLTALISQRKTNETSFYSLLQSPKSLTNSLTQFIRTRKLMRLSSNLSTSKNSYQNDLYRTPLAIKYLFYMAANKKATVA